MDTRRIKDDSMMCKEALNFKPLRTIKVVEEETTILQAQNVRHQYLIVPQHPKTIIPYPPPKHPQTSRRGNKAATKLAAYIRASKCSTSTLETIMREAEVINLWYNKNNIIKRLYKVTETIIIFLIEVH